MSGLKDSTMPLFESNCTESSNSVLPEEDKVYLYALKLVRGLGYNSVRRLYELKFSAKSIWCSDKNDLLIALKNFKIAKIDYVVNEIVTNDNYYLNRASEELEKLEKRNIHFILEREKSFPEVLKGTPNPPYWLFVEGNLECISGNDLVTVVGTRNPTEEGLNNTRILTSLLVEKGFTVVSGLAEGIDATAHQTVIDFGGKTIAILGNGISIVFPAKTGHIRTQIVESGGAIISEYFPNETYSRQRFVQRNRIQAALGQVLFPVQCQIKGGTTHTISFAENLKKLVVGVKRGHPAPVPQNEVFELLKRKNYPVFDLESDQDKLWEYLKEIIPLGKTPSSVKLDKTRKFNRVLQEFRRVLEQYPVSEDEISDLLRVLEKDWENYKK
jgi:DNA protecting protein DprA